MSEILSAETEMLKNTIIKGIQEVKGKDIICLDLREVHNSVCDYFVLCHGNSTTQVTAIYESIIKETELLMDERPWHKEGVSNAEWVLLDYFNVVAHVFHRDSRGFYNLENLWADAQISKIEYDI